MPRAKKIAGFSLVVLLLLLAVAYVWVNGALDRMSRRAASQLVELADRKGVEVVDPDFASVRLSGIASATWSDLSATVKLTEAETVVSERPWEVHIDHVTANWSARDPTLISADHITIDAAKLDQDDDAPQRQVELRGFRYQVDLSLSNPRPAVRQVVSELVRLISQGNTSRPFEVSGKIVFTLRGEPAEVKAQAVGKNDAYMVLLDRDDVAPLSNRFDERLTEAEVDIICAKPLRAMRLLEIKESAESAARRANELDATVPQDAYRHVLWSYLLATAYGEPFAKEVGDAHESGETGNTPAERQMDLHNNAIGRRYAAENVKRSDVLSRVMSDANVRREPKPIE